MTAQKETVVSVKQLSTRMAGRSIHSDLDLQLYRGEVLALIGGSGSGKSILLHHIIGLLVPVTGTIEVLGTPIHTLSASQVRKQRLHWGVLFQQGALFSALTVYDNVAFPLRELRKDGVDLNEDSLSQLVYMKLQMVGININDAWKYPAELSGGMVKRVALARALALDAEVLFLDEPTSGLDPVLSDEFDNLLLELRRELNLSVLLITHDLNSLATLSDRVAILEEGRVLTSGTLEDVAKYQHPFVHQFFRQRQGDARLHALDIP